MSKYVSFELAKQLKDAGLKWEPKEYDRYYYETSELRVLEPVELYGEDIDPDMIWAPDHDDLLEWLEKHGWECASDPGFGNYEADITPRPRHNASIWNSFHDDTRIGAVADAVLWVLEQEKDVNHE